MAIDKYVQMHKLFANAKEKKKRKATYTTALLYTIPPFNKLNLSGLWPIVRSSIACHVER